MARFQSTGLDDLFSDMGKMGQTTGPLAEKMLFAGAEEVKKAWKQAALNKKVKLTGQVIESIGYPKKPKRVGDVLSIDIYPIGFQTYTEKNGKIYHRKKPVRNAEVAFIANYKSTKKHQPTHFVDDADDMAGPMVEEVITKIYDEWLGENGMI